MRTVKPEPGFSGFVQSVARSVTDSRKRASSGDEIAVASAENHVTGGIREKSRVGQT